MITKTFDANSDRPVAQVTFTIPSHIWADTIHLVGDFNDWNCASHPFRCSHDGHWTITIYLDMNKAYQFRYLCNGREWMNDSTADGYVPNRHGSENCLIITQSDFAPHVA